MKRIELQDVSVRFGDLQALDKVTTQLQSGEILMLVGPNGAGKSTLLKVLLGLIEADACTLKVDGQPARVDKKFKSHLGYLPESVAFSESLSGKQVMRFFARARGVAVSEVDAVLKRVGLAHAAKRAIRGYSRGMRQRLGLGIAILGDPDLLVLDEPTGGLDQEGLSVLWDVLENSRKRGRMVILSSHDLTLLEKRVDRICLLAEGRVLADDTPDVLRRQAALPVRVSFDFAGAMADDTSPFTHALSLAGLAADLTPRVGGLGVNVPPDQLLKLLDVRGQFNGAVQGVRVQEPGLDAVYDHLLATGGAGSPAATAEVN
ncbi:MAG: ABC transporter ATP-binding protein [Myxococcales bacterium]|nr:ABC transporter ATP-binding protein [Myxococcales bacterium]